MPDLRNRSGTLQESDERPLASGRRMRELNQSIPGCDEFVPQGLGGRLSVGAARMQRQQRRYPAFQHRDEVIDALLGEGAPPAPDFPHRVRKQALWPV